MKLRISGVKSLILMKQLIVVTVLFTVIFQIVPALWANNKVFESHKTVLKGHKYVQASSSHDDSLYTTSAPRLFATDSGQTNIRWNSKGLECVLRRDTKTTTPLSPNTQTLPIKFDKVIWPPVPQENCGDRPLLNPWSLDGEKRPWMLFMVKSAPHHFSYRNMVRTSWGSISSFYNKTIAIVFLLGVPVAQNSTESWKKAMEEENQQFGDILQCPVQDTYRNLPNKVLSALSWILRRNFTGTFYTLTDDDCMMKMTSIYVFFDHLTANERRDHIYCGFQYGAKSKPIRQPTNKWYISNELYSEDLYPPFCHGGMYTMTKPVMTSIYCMSEITNTSGFHLEDVLITGILRKKIGDGKTGVKRISTATGKVFDVMYYPWDGSPSRTLWKMGYRWNSWNRTLLQYRQRNLLKSKPLPHEVNRSLVYKLQSFWRKEWRGMLDSKDHYSFKISGRTNLTSGKK